MSLFDKLFGRAPKPAGEYDSFFRMLNGYVPRFSSWGGCIYESELVRASINALATNIGKLKVETTGAAKRSLQDKLRRGPNQFQTWSQFLQRAATIFYVHNTCIVTPVFDEYGEISGVYTPLPDRCEIVQYKNTPYLRYEFGSGEKASIELSLCGIMVRMQHRNDFFGEPNDALLPTMNLIHIQDQGIEEGVKSAATYRFMARMNNFVKPEDLAKERKRFTELNFSREAEGGGLLLFPNTYADVKQVDVKPWVADPDQMKIIKDNVFNYFGVNEDVLQGKAFGDAWSAFYECCIEPFAIQFSEVMTKMLFTPRERLAGNGVMATANRLQYMTNNDKLNVSAQMLDRGLMTINEVREIWQLPPVEGGDVRIIRGEYYDANSKLLGDEPKGED
jgi:hypothetical protein